MAVSVRTGSLGPSVDRTDEVSTARMRKVQFPVRWTRGSIRLTSFARCDLRQNGLTKNLHAATLADLLKADVPSTLL
jgi:hypothetical protein